MKFARAATPLLLILALSACSGPSLPFQSNGTADTGSIQKGFQALMDNYVDQPRPEALLQAAYQGALKAVTDQGLQPSGLQAPSWTSGQAANWDRFVQAYGQLAGKYAPNVGSDKLQDAALSSMAASLKDCLTEYYNADAFKQRQVELTGQQGFGGIGVLMRNIPGHPTVQRILDGPAQSSGMKPGDEIVAVDGKPVSGETFEQVRNSIRGPQGQPVKISVKRPGAAQTLDFTINRAQIQAPIVDAAIIQGNVGYIHLYSFPTGIVQEVDHALDVFSQNGVTSVVFDVRANTGGDQQSILQVLSRFIKTGTVEQQIERGGATTPFAVDGSSFWKNPRPLIVLADQDTQAGGESFVKAMQEEGGYRVLGTQTAGCAASAKVIDMGGGAAMEISTGKIVSGKGADINRSGVKPDQAVEFPVADLAAGQDPQLSAALQVAGISSSPGPSTTSSSAPRPQPAPLNG
ncbi:MAG: PDZ domain-containing protein, partial [Chloroflexi bacterium]|nr:PDZ domain-containing protein [Chloroflexota bacterium]